MDGKNIVLSPLSPKEVYDDQKIMRERERTHEREKEKNVLLKRELLERKWGVWAKSGKKRGCVKEMRGACIRKDRGKKEREANEFLYKR